MGTRSRIAMALPGGKFRSIYCHWDGYPQELGVGWTLLRYYDEDKTQKLLDLGDVSSLKKEIGEKHDFNARPEGQTTFYRRDRGEAGVSAKLSETFAELTKLADDCNAEWLYILLDGQWLFSEVWLRDNSPADIGSMTLLTTEATELKSER